MMQLITYSKVMPKHLKVFPKTNRKSQSRIRQDICKHRNRGTARKRPDIDDTNDDILLNPFFYD